MVYGRSCTEGALAQNCVSKLHHIIGEIWKRIGLTMYQILKIISNITQSWCPCMCRIIQPSTQTCFLLSVIYISRNFGCLDTGNLDINLAQPTFNCYAEGSGCLNGRRSCGGGIVQHEYYSNSFWNITALSHSVTQFSFNKWWINMAFSFIRDWSIACI